MMFNMFTEPKLIEPEKALPGREACASPASRRIHTHITTCYYTPTTARDRTGCKRRPVGRRPPPGHKLVLRMAASWVPQAPMRVSDRHAVLGSKMKGPWPAGYKVAVFANGCFWGSEKGIWRLPGDCIYTTAVGAT